MDKFADLFELITETASKTEFTEADFSGPFSVLEVALGAAMRVIGNSETGLAAVAREVEGLMKETSIPEGMENEAAAISEFAGKRVDPSEEKHLNFAIHLQGGLVQHVFCKDTKGFDCLFSTFDYEGLENMTDDELTLITQNNGEKEEAYVCHQKIDTLPFIQLDDVFKGGRD